MLLREEFRQRGITLDFIPMEEGLDGILIDFPSHWLCLINNLKPPLRQRFTMAHELAHYDLHRGMAQVFTDGLQIEQTRMEREANAEAARRLMPAPKIIDLLRCLMKEYDRFNLAQLVAIFAEIFQVSQQAMAYRLSDPDVALVSWERANQCVNEEWKMMREAQRAIKKTNSG